MENGKIMCNVDSEIVIFYLFFAGKKPDAVNFWLGEGSAVTSSEFVFTCS